MRADLVSVAGKTRLYALTKGNRPQLFALQPVPTPDQTATQMVYICQAPDVPGRFDNKKAVALGVPNGKIRQNLVRGEAIEFEDPKNPGQMKVVRPEEVVSNGTKGAVSLETSLKRTTLMSKDDDHGQLFV
jgi:ribonuclease Z